MRHKGLEKRHGETLDVARERADKEVAVMARIAGLGDLICEDCDRIKAACYRDPLTCQSRKDKKRGCKKVN